LRYRQGARHLKALILEAIREKDLKIGSVSIFRSYLEMGIIPSLF